MPVSDFCVGAGFLFRIRIRTSDSDSDFRFWFRIQHRYRIGGNPELEQIPVLEQNPNPSSRALDRTSPVLTRGSSNRGAIGGPLSLGAALSGIRESDGESLSQFAARLGISRTHLCDIEQGRRTVSPERAARFAKALKQHQAQFVRLALQDQVRNAGLRLKVDVRAA